MTKGVSEAHVRAALNAMQLDLLVYKPPDDARNWKPADFLVWWRGGTAFLEVKQTQARARFPVRELRPSQVAAMHQAARVGIPYWLVIWWPKVGRWTVSDTAKILARFEGDATPTSLEYPWLCSVVGMDCTTRDLAPILRSVLLGEVD